MRSPNWIRPVAHSTARVSSRSMAPVQRAPMCSRSSTNHSLVIMSASPIPPRIASALTRTSVSTNCG